MSVKMTIVTPMIMITLQQVIITTDNVDVGTVDNQENVEPDNRKDPARFVNLFFHFILMTLTLTIPPGLSTCFFISFSLQ